MLSLLASARHAMQLHCIPRFIHLGLAEAMWLTVLTHRLTCHAEHPLRQHPVSHRISAAAQQQIGTDR